MPVSLIAICRNAIDPRRSGYRKNHCSCRLPHSPTRSPSTYAGQGFTTHRRRCVIVNSSGSDDARASFGVRFDGLDPEEKAGKALLKLFTFVAAKTIMEEIESYQEGMACHDPIWIGLQAALVAGMGETFVEDLLKSDDSHMRMVALRVVEVRNYYMSEAFNWDKMRGSAMKFSDEEKDRAFSDYMKSIVPNLMAEDVEHHQDSNEQRD